jgi:hypothetical protein
MELRDRFGPFGAGELPPCRARPGPAAAGVLAGGGGRLGARPCSRAGTGQANLARAAYGHGGVAAATLTGHFHTMEARALTRLGDVRGDRALEEAVRKFEQRRPDDDPDWMWYFDERELAAEFEHRLRGLGRSVDAAQCASQSVGAADGTGFVRSAAEAWAALEKALAATILLGPAAQARRRRSPRSPQMPGPVMC